tara:strand:- start:2 stop:463 length:462 start_codon:yes stop_codon:yes gene_type:complete
MCKNNEKRIRFAPVPLAILEEYCELHGMTPSAAISPLIAAHLRHPLACVASFVPNEYKIHSRESADLPQIAAKQKPKTQKKNKTPLPKDFDPPKAICAEAGVDHEKAVRFFKAQAEAKGYTYANWNKAFALAVNGWLPQNYPQILQTRQENEF